MQQLLRVHQQEMVSNDINRNVQQMAAGFGTAQQQASKMAALAGGGGQGGGDTLGALGEIQKLQQGQMDIANQQRFQAGAETLGQAFGLKKGQGGLLSSDPNLFNSVIQQKMRDQSPTEAKKNYEQARDEMKKQGMTDDEINQIMPPELMVLGAGANREDSQYIQEKAKATRAGQPFPGFVEWKTAHQVSAAAQTTQAKDAQDFKDSAVEDFSKVNDKLTRNEGTVDKLLGDINGTMKALSTPDILTTGKGAAAIHNLPVVGSLISPSDTTRALAHDIQTLKAELTGQGLTDVKNVRNRMEFETLGNALTAALDAGNSPEAVKAALINIKRKFAVAKAQALATAGKPIPDQYNGLADPAYLTKTLPNGQPNPYYTGAHYESPASGGSGDGGGPRRKKYNPQTGDFE